MTPHLLLAFCNFKLSAVLFIGLFEALVPMYRVRYVATPARKRPRSPWHALRPYLSACYLRTCVNQPLGDVLLKLYAGRPVSVI